MLEDVRAMFHGDAVGRDRFVNLTAKNYVSRINKASGVPYLRFGQSESVVHYDDMTAQPASKLENLACCCAGPEDAKALASVCGDVLRTTYESCPVNDMAKEFDALHGRAARIPYSDTFTEAKREWVDAYRDVFKNTMSETYHQLGLYSELNDLSRMDEARSLQVAFAENLDGQSYACLCQALQQDDLKKLQKSMELLDTPPHREKFGRACGRVEIDPGDVKNGLEGLMYRHALKSDTPGFYDRYEASVERHYSNIALNQVCEYLTVPGETAAPSLPEGPVARPDILVTGCDCYDKERLGEQARTLAEMCNQMYHEAPQFVEQVMQKDSVQDLLKVRVATDEGQFIMTSSDKYWGDSARHYGEKQVQGQVVQDAVRVCEVLRDIDHDPFSGRSDAAAEFVSGMSDDLWLAVYQYHINDKFAYDSEFKRMDVDKLRADSKYQTYFDVLDNEPSSSDGFVPRRDVTGKLSPAWFESKGLDMAVTERRLAEYGQSPLEECPVAVHVEHEVLRPAAPGSVSAPSVRSVSTGCDKSLRGLEISSAGDSADKSCSL